LGRVTEHDYVRVRLESRKQRLVRSLTGYLEKPLRGGITNAWFGVIQQLHERCHGIWPVSLGVGGQQSFVPNMRRIEWPRTKHRFTDGKRRIINDAVDERPGLRCAKR
jgi:hypothetical protein